MWIINISRPSGPELPHRDISNPDFQGCGLSITQSPVDLCKHFELSVVPTKKDVDYQLLVVKLASVTTSKYQ